MGVLRTKAPWLAPRVFACAVFGLVLFVLSPASAQTCSSLVQKDYVAAGSSSGIYGDGTYIYLANNSNGLKAYTFDGSSFTLAGSTNPGNSIYDVYSDGTYVYAANYTSGLRAYSFDGTNFTLKDTATGIGQVYGVWGDGTHIFAASYDSGIFAFTFNGTSLTAAGSYNTSGNVFGIWGDGTYIYVADQTGGLDAFSYNGSSFTLLDNIGTGAQAYDVWGDGTYIYLANHSEGIEAYTFDGTTLTKVGNTYDTAGFGRRLYGAGDRIFLADWGKLRVFTFDGTNFTEVATDTDSVSAQDVWYDGNYIYTADSSSGIRAFSGCGGFGPKPCNASYAGVMLYNSDESVLQYCNATDWIDMGPKGLTGGSTNGLVAYWNLNESSGTSASDSAGSNTGTLNGGPVWQPSGGHVGGALLFDGVNDEINAGSAAALDNIAPVTACAWINPTTRPTQYPMIFDKSSNGWDGWNFYMRSDGFGYYDIMGDWKEARNNSINLGVWQHVCATWDGTDGVAGIALYVNGALQTTSIATGTGAPVDDSANSFRIGRQGDGLQRFNGLIDEARIYNRALNASEIMDLYLNTGGGAGTCSSPDGVPGEVDYNYTQGVMQYCNGASWINMGPILSTPASTTTLTEAPTSGLISHWKLDETSGSSIADSVGSNAGIWSDNVDNNVTGETTTGQIGSAITFDGVDDIITNTNPVFTGTSGTVSVWVRPATLDTSAQPTSGLSHIFSRPGFATNERIYLYQQNENFGVGVADFATHDTGANFALNTWAQIALTWSGGSYKAYMNGALVDSGTYTGMAVTNSCNRYNFGGYTECDGTGPKAWFSGKIDDIRTYNRALSDNEIEALYKFSGLAAHWKLDEASSATTAADETGVYNGTLSGATVSFTPGGGVSGGAATFNLSGSTINIGTINEIQSASKITLSGWMKRAAASQQVKFGKINSPGFNSATYIDAYTDGNTHFGIASGVDAYGTIALNDTSWHYLTLVFDGTQTGNANRLKGYVDGEQVTLSFTGTIPALTTSDTTAFGIGKLYPGATGSNGMIDDVRVYNTALSAAAVKTLYDNSGAGLSVPTACPQPGDVCSDGTVYAGVSPDGSVKMYATHCDKGATWDGSTCSGASAGTSWNSGTTNYTTTSVTNADTGVANTASLITIDSDSVTAGAQQHNAAQYCADLIEDGHDDWYLPAFNELNILYTNQNAIGNFNMPNPKYYWSSTENSNSSAKDISFFTGTPANDSKGSGWGVRCVRKGGGLALGSCSSPAGVAGAMVYNADNAIMQYCNGERWIGIR